MEGKKDNDFGFEYANFQIIFFRNGLNLVTHHMLLFQCDFEMFSTKRLGSFPPVTEWIFVTIMTNRI